MFCVLNSPKLSVGGHKVKLVLDLLLSFFVCFLMLPLKYYGREFFS